MGIKTLSSDSLMLIRYCVDNEKARLTRLHWDTIGFLPPADYKPGANAIETIINIARYQTKIDNAMKEVYRVFEEQFTPEEHARVNKRYEKDNSVGNTRPLRKKRKACQEKAPSRMGQSGAKNFRWPHAYGSRSRPVDKSRE